MIGKEEIRWEYNAIRFFEIWNSKIWNIYRKDLFNGKREKSPCAQCNCDGTVHGSKHMNSWKNFWKTTS